MRLVGKHAVVYGAGMSGVASYELLREKGAKAIIYDDDTGAKRATSSKGVFDGADMIVLSPGVDANKDFILDARLEGAIVMSELALASSLCDAEQIAVTGTNGKTTTTMLIDYVLKRAGLHSHAVGNIGVPFCSIADKLDATEIAVIEASSFQLENSPNFAPDIAVMLNVSPDHLSRHKTMQNYVGAKSNIFLKQSEQDYIVYNADDEEIKALTPQMVAKKVPFSTSHVEIEGAYLSSGFVCFRGKPVVPLEDMDFSGKEIENVLACVAVCMIKGVSPFNIASAITDFSKPPYRRQLCGTIDGIKVYNDSKATNVSACECACECVAREGDFVLILGGQKGEEDFDALFESLKKNCADHLKGIVACGQNSDIVFACGVRAGFEVFVRESLHEAIALALDKAKRCEAKSVLFSPSSKSFDKYSSFEERGRVFDALVGTIAK